MSNLPNDPAMLLSVINTKLRDYHSSLDELCKSEEVNKQELIEKLKLIDYDYNENLNQFK